MPDDLDIPTFLKRGHPDNAWLVNATSPRSLLSEGLWADVETKRDWRKPKSMPDEEWAALEAERAAEARRKRDEGLAQLAEHKARAKAERQEIEAVKAAAAKEARRGKK